MIYLLCLSGTIFFLLLQGFFCASEIAFVSTDFLRLQKKKEKDKKAYILEKILAIPERYFSTILVGTNLSMVISTTLITYFLTEAGIKNSNLWVTFLFTPLVVIFAELFPKNIARYYQEDLAIKIAELFKFWEKVFYPLVISIEIVTSLFTKIFIKKKRKRKIPFSVKEEIKALIAEVEKEGGLEKGEREAIEDIFDFVQKKVKDICVPLRKVCTIDYSDSSEKIKEKIQKFKFTRYPVLTQHKIVGYLNIFDLFYQEEKDWRQLIRPISFVGSSQKLYEVFSLLKNKKENIAVVMKGKKTLGIITLEDIIKEILISLSK